MELIYNLGGKKVIEIIPDWLKDLDEEDVSFIKNFILSSGSLKEMARLYNVSYPTVRLRLDKLIQKVKLSQEIAEDSYIKIIKKLAIDEKIAYADAKLLISEYKKKVLRESGGA